METSEVCNTSFILVYLQFQVSQKVTVIYRKFFIFNKKKKILDWVFIESM